MDGHGDGLHNGRNRQNLHLLLFPRGDRPPADQLNAGVVAWMEFLINQGFDDFEFMILQPEHQLDNVNQGNNNADADEDEDNNDDTVNDNDDNNDTVNDNNDNDIVNNHNDNDIVNDHNDNNDNEDNNDSNGVRGNDSVNNDVDDTDSLPRVSRKRSREEDEERDEESKRFRWWDEFAESSTDSDTDNNDCDYNHTDKNTDVPEERPLPGPSRKRSREHDEEDDRSCKKARQLGDRNSDSARAGQDEALGSHSSHLAQGPGATDTDSEYNATDKITESSSVIQTGAGAEVSEERPLPGPSRKRSREHDEEEERSSKKARQLGDRDSDSARTGQHHTLSSHSSHLAQGPGATEETDKDVNQEVEEDDRRPRKCKKKSRL